MDAYHFIVIFLFITCSLSGSLSSVTTNIDKKLILKITNSRSTEEYQSVLGRQNQRIALFTIYQQSKGHVLPSFMNYWAQSCGWQSKHVDCYLYVILSQEEALSIRQENLLRVFPCRVSNESRHGSRLLSESLNLPGNVFLRILSFPEWRAVFQKKIPGVFPPKSISNHHKQVDYKVLYGTLFEDILTKPENSYSYFGWLDPDVILGDLISFMSKNPSPSATAESSSFPSSSISWQHYDIYTSYYLTGYHEGTVAGQITVFRNLAVYRHLWEYAPFIREKLSSEKEYGSDERVLGKLIYDLLEYNSSLLSFHAEDDTLLDCLFSKGELYYEKGKILRSGICGYDEIPTKEAVVLHLACYKHGHSSKSCSSTSSSSSSPSFGWLLPRWNISIYNNDGSSTFHDDPQWSLVKSASDTGCIQRNQLRFAKPNKAGLVQSWKEYFGYF
jgi:hypothetical protein